MAAGYCGIVGVRLFSGPFEPPDCHDLDLGVTIEECEWEIAIDEEGKKIDLILRINGEQAGSIELEIIDLSDDYLFAEAPHQQGWNGYIHVQDRYQRHGLGTLLWKQGDKAIRHTYGSGQVRIYIDASATNFSSTIRRQVMPIFATADGDFIYVIR